ncbi:DM13 domain-containing protein, partial [Streptomyces sp. NPDC059564]|uniref:DM13 domain-containing protein n=1 Tax=Streptomyces sp. NPDC059564 TaxID=3346865 RepID=UPI0036AECC1D
AVAGLGERGGRGFENGRDGDEAARTSMGRARVTEGTDGWRVFDDGGYVSLGKLKGNQGNQNYGIPADVNLADFPSVTIWCDRFDVSFGAAALTSGAA